jgi:hypothetical protein
MAHVTRQPVRDRAGVGPALSPTGRLLGSIDSLDASEIELSISNPHPGSRATCFIKPFHDELRRQSRAGKSPLLWPYLGEPLDPHDFICHSPAPLLPKISNQPINDRAKVVVRQIDRADRQQYS